MALDKKNSIMIKRLKAEMQRVGINARELAEKANVGRSFVYDILSGKSENPTTKKLSAIANVLGVNVLYLLGQDEKKLPENNAGIFFVDDDVVTVASIIVEGNGTAVIDEKSSESFYHFKKSWIKNQLNTTENDLRTLRIVGDSMYPTLMDGDRVLIDTKQKIPSPPGIFILFDGMGLVAKRLEVYSEDGVVRVISDNTQYAQYRKSLSEINIIGRIVWFAREI